MLIAPRGKSRVTTRPITIPCALSKFAIFVGLLPTTVTPLFELLPLVEEGEEALPVVVELPEVESVVKGFESEDIAAAVRSSVNWRVFEVECWFMLKEVSVLSIALPCAHAAMNGEDFDVEAERSVQVVPGFLLALRVCHALN